MDDRFEFGRTIGAYRIVRPLGSGGMGAVYEVEHLQLRTHRALKVFAVEGENVELHRKRFLSKGKMLAALDHPRVVRVHEFDVDAESGRPYFVMDLVLSPDGTPRTLADVGSEGADEKRTAALFRDVCEGLDYVHSLGIVHRDIKLENILIGPDGRAVLSDFGISRIFDDELRRKLDITLTMPQDETIVRRLGSTFYLAPEQQGETPEKATPASDAWALGVMIFRFLTGFWFERANREKCLALLDDCELPWRPLIARLCAETPEERLAEDGFVSLADTLKQKQGSSVSAGSQRRWVFVWVAALVVIAVGVAFALLRDYDAALKRVEDEAKYIKPIEDVLNRHDDEMKKEMEAIKDKVEEACPEVSTNQPLVRVRREQKRRERKMAEMAKRLMFEEVMAKYIPLYDKAFAEAKEVKVPAHLEARKRELINDQEWNYQGMKSAKEQYDLEVAKRKATGAADEDDEKPPTDGKWHGLEWADVWAESVRTNAVLPTAWKYFTEQFRPYVRRNLMVPEEGPFAKDVSELVDGLARTLWTPWTPLDEEFAGWGIIGDFNRAMELRGKGCSNLVVRALATIGDYRQHMKKRRSIDPKGKESEPYRQMKAELAAHGGVPLLRYIYGRQISWWSDSDAMKDILDGLKARPQDRRVVYNIIGTPEEACAADPWFELMAVAADERYAARKVRNDEERCQHRGKAREALEKAYAQHPEVVETAVALLKDAVDGGNEEAKELWFGRILEQEVDNRDSWYLYAACWASVERLRMFFEVLWMIDRKDMFFRYQAAEFLVYMDQQAGGKGKFFLDPGQRELYLNGCHSVIDGAMVDDETVIRAREGIVRRYWEVGDMEGAGKAYQELIARAPYRFQRHGSWFEDMDLVIPALGGAHAKELIEMERFYQKNFAKVRRPTKSAVEAMRALLKPLKEKSSELSHAERMLFNTRNGAMSISLE